MSIRFSVLERFLTIEDFLDWLKEAEGSYDVKVIKRLIPNGYELEEIYGTTCSYIYLRNSYLNAQETKIFIGTCYYDCADEIMIKKGGK